MSLIDSVGCGFDEKRRMMSMTSKRPIAVGIGELLWDVLPEGKQLGGAPFNFARHCAQLGLDAFPVSRVGIDELGNEALSLLESWGVETAYVSKDTISETGTVQVAFDVEGKPSYEIRDGAAWDSLTLSDELLELAPRVDVVCFGTLAQRNECSQRAIYGFLDRMRPDALKLFDVNLRQAFYSSTVLEESLQRATVLKLSDEELPILKKIFSLEGSVEDQLIGLKERFGLKLIAYTRGAGGSLLVNASSTDDHLGQTVEMEDTIGAGDSFAATLCVGLIAGWPLPKLNENANKVAAYVCSQRGATPDLPERLANSVSPQSLFSL